MANIAGFRPGGFEGTVANFGADARREVIIKYRGDIDFLESAIGADVEILGGGYAIVALDYPQIADLYDYPEIIYVERPRNLVWTLSSSLAYTRITGVQSPSSYGLTGRGVLVAVIDSGIDYTHPDFLDENGNTRILSLWDQTVPGAPPPGFRYGTEYTKADIDAALASPAPLSVVPSTDTVGHGTAVAGIAAGNGRASGGRDVGVAPEASIIAVKLGSHGWESFAQTTEFMRALKFVIDRAEALDMPIAINISFGTNDGSHDGFSLFESFVNEQAQRWKTVIVVASGNEGYAGHHYHGHAQPGDSQIDVDFAVAPNLRTLYLSFWKSFVDTFNVELISPGGYSTGIVRTEDGFRTAYLEGVITAVQFGQPTHYNADQDIYFQLNAMANGPIPQGIWRIRVHTERVVDGRFDIWLPTEEEVGTQTAFSRPEADTTLTLPSTAMNVITVGAYNGPVEGSISFSGRGFTRGNVFAKPDLVAPGLGIRAPSPGGGYDTLSGTSVAAPFVTGSAALMMQWGIVQENDIFLYGQRVKAFLLKGARHVPRITYPDTYWGYGMLSLRETLDYLVLYTRGGTFIP